MYAQIKRFFRQSVIYGIGHVINRGIAFILLPIYTNYLSSEEFGQVALLFLLFHLLNILVTCGLDSAFLRYYSLEGNIDGRREIFSTSFIGLIFNNLIIITVGLSFYSQLSKFVLGNSSSSESIYLVFCFLLFETLSVNIFHLLRINKKAVAFSLIKIFSVLINLGCHAYFVIILGYGAKGVFLSYVISSGITFLIILPVFIKNMFWRFSFSKLRELFHFGSPYVFTQFFVTIVELSDRYFIKQFLDLASVGIYQAGYRLGMIMTLFNMAFYLAWHPFFLSYSKNDNAKSVYAKILTHFIFVELFIFLVLALFLKDILTLEIHGKSLVTAPYLGALPIVPYVLASYIFWGVYLNLVVGVHLKKKTIYQPIATGLGCLINVLGNIILIPIFGILGAAITTIVSYFVMVCCLYFLVQRIYYIPYEHVKILKLIVATGFIFALNKLLFIDEPFLTRLTLIPLLLLVMYLMNRVKA